MKAKYLIILLVLLLTECKDKDVIPAADKYLSYVDNDEGKRLIEFEYDEKKRIKKIQTIQNQSPVDIRIMYDEKGRVKELYFEPSLISCEYNASGMLSGYSVQGTNYSIVNDPAGRKYTMSVDGDSFDFYFNAEGRPIEFTLLNIFYDSGKGPLYNVDVPLELALLPYGLFLQVFLLNNIFSSPLEAVLGDISSTDISFKNTYDKDGFLTRSIRTNKVYNSNTGPATVTTYSYNYHYTALK